MLNKMDDVFNLDSMVKNIENFIMKEKKPFVDFYMEFDPKIDYIVEAPQNIIEYVLKKLSMHALKNTAGGCIAFTIKQLERGRFNALIEFTVVYTGSGHTQEEIETLFKGNPKNVIDKNHFECVFEDNMLPVDKLVEFIFGAVFCEAISGHCTSLILRVPFKTINEKYSTELPEVNFNVSGVKAN